MKKLIPTLLASVLLMSACSGVQTSGQETVKIGVIAPMTGDAAAYGQEMQHILDYAVGQINTAQVDSPYQFELVYEDGQCGAAAATALQKLVDVDGVQFIIGGACSSESLAIAPLLEEKGVVAVSALSSNPELDGLSPNFLSLSYSDSGVGEGIAAQLSRYSKVAILGEQNDYNVGLHDTVLEALKAYPSVELVADESVEKGATDFRNALQKVKASGAEAVFFNTNPGVTTETLVKQLAELSDWEVAKVAIFDFMNEAYYDLAPEVFVDMLVVDTPKVTSTEFTAMMEAVTAANGTVEDLGSFYTASTYDALTVLTKGILNEGSDPEMVLADIRESSFTGYLGELTFGQGTFVQGIGTAVYAVKGGVWVQQ